MDATTNNLSIQNPPDTHSSSRTITLHLESNIQEGVTSLGNTGTGRVCQQFEAEQINNMPVEEVFSRSNTNANDGFHNDNDDINDNNKLLEKIRDLAISSMDEMKGGGTLNKSEEIKHLLDDGNESHFGTSAANTELCKTEATDKTCFSVHPFLKEYKHCFFHWISAKKPFTVDEADTITSVVADKFQNITGPLVLKQLEWIPLETISQHLCLSFCHIVRRRFTQSDAELEKVANYIKQAAEKSYISIDYVEGFVYVFAGLEAFKKSLILEYSNGEERVTNEGELKSFITKSTRYDSLTKIAQAAVTGVRLFFTGNRRHNAEELELIQEIIIVDAENAEWLVNLHFVNRICRRERNYREGPSEEEKQAVIKALDVNQNHPMVKMSACTYLSDVVKAKTWDPLVNELALGVHVEFQSVKEIIDYMKEHCKEIHQVLEYSSKINIAIAEIFSSSSLPFEHRDHHMAKHCLNNALVMNPKSSKANHKMGLFMLTVEKKLEEASQYMKAAFESDPRNFSALIDTIQVMLSKPNENAAELTTTFQQQITTNSQWSTSRLSSLLVCKGFFNFMRCEKEEALWAWIAASTTDSDSFKAFKQIPFYCKRYHWNEKLISSGSICDYLQSIKSDDGKSLKKQPRVDELDLINKLLNHLESVEDCRNGNRNKHLYRGHGGLRKVRGSRGGGRGGNPDRSEQADYVYNSQPQTSDSGIFRNRNRGGKGRGDLRNAVNSKDNPQGLPTSSKVRDPVAPRHDSGRGFSSRGGRDRGRGKGKGRARGNGECHAGKH